MKINKNDLLNLALYVFLLTSAVFTQACKEKDSEVEPVETKSVSTAKETYSDSSFVTTDWTSSTHSKKGVPNFTLVYDDRKYSASTLSSPKTGGNSCLKT